MTEEEKELIITYLTKMQEEYIEGEGYERHPLPEYYALDMAIKALEQQPSDCKIFGHKENCFGGATENDCEHCDYKIQKLEQHSDDCVSRKDVLEMFGYETTIYDLPPVTPKIPTSEDCVSRADLLKLYEDRFIELQKAHQQDKQLGVNWCINTLKEMPPVTPTHGTCKDCRHCREDFSFTDKPMCLTHGLITVNDDFYCADFERREE